MMKSRKLHGWRARSIVWSAVVAGALLLFAGGALTVSVADADDGPPLPLHTIEGVGGIVLTPMAYLVNPGPDGTTLGKPAMAAHFALIGDKDLTAYTVTWTLYRRLELGYALNRLGLNDFDDDIRDALMVDIRTNEIYMHHLNARVAVIQENEWDLNWMPAVTVGAHYKCNEDIHKINRRLGDALETIGYNDNDGVDFTVTATKTLTGLPRTVMVSAGARASKASQFGLLGFGDDYLVTFEGSVLVLMTGNFAVGAEYRQKREALDNIPPLLEHEDSWWDVHCAYIVNDHMTISATIGNAGAVANDTDETLYGLVFKYEF